jgi:hypothetical protein
MWGRIYLPRKRESKMTWLARMLMWCGRRRRRRE